MTMLHRKYMKSYVYMSNKTLTIGHPTIEAFQIIKCTYVITLSKLTLFHIHKCLELKYIQKVFYLKITYIKTSFKQPMFWS